MAREITVPELALLRADTQWSKLYLAIYQPNTVYTALLNGVPSSNDRVYQITFDGGAGTLADVKAGMTLYVGTVAGAYDLGMARIRKTPGASTFYIGLTSEITWADNCYLTVVDDFDLWAKHATIASTVLSMDVDVAYSDQHADFNPVPVLGPHAVAWLDAATVNVAFAASDSWVIGSTISAYAWTAPGSSASSGMATATPTITYNAAGCYRVLCTVTAANGKTTTGVRHVFVYDRDANQPSTVFQLSQCIGDHDTGGWMFDMTMEAEASLSEIRDRALVVLFAEDYYGSTAQSIGPVANRENIVCVGRIVGESIRWDRETGQVHFTVQGLHNWLNKIKTFPVELAFVGVAGAWNQMPALTVDRVLWHILYWHSTAIETMDFYPSNDTRYSADGKTIASTIWGQVNDIAFSKIFAAPGVDRFGRLIVEVDQQMVPEADRAAPVVMTLTDADWVEAIDFSRVIVQDCSLISLNAEEVNAAGTAVTRYALSPGHVPLRYGEPEMMERVLCASQSNANELAGLVLGWRTNQYPDVPLNFAQNNRMIDCFPRQVCGFSVATGDTPRAVAYAGQLIPRRVAFYFDGDSGYFHAEINFEGETFAQIATNGDIPDTDALDMEIPPLPSLPSLPNLPILLPGLGDIPSDAVLLAGPRKVLVHDGLAGLCLSANFNITSPTWLQINSGLTSAQYQRINQIVICPNGVVYAAALGVCDGASIQPFIARAPYIGGTFVIVQDVASIRAFYSKGFDNNCSVYAINCNPLLPEAVAYVIGDRSTETADAFYGTGGTFAQKANMTTVLGGGSLTYGLNAWMLSIQGWSFGPVGQYRLLTFDMAAVTSSANAWNYEKRFHKRLGTSGKTYHYGADGTIHVGTDNYAANVQVGSLLVPNSWNQFAHDPTGQFMMMPWHTTVKGKSSDGGASWSDLTGLPLSSRYCFAYVNGAGAASGWIAGSSYLYYSPDFGATWINKQGNLHTLNPLYSVDIVKVVQI